MRIRVIRGTLLLCWWSALAVAPSLGTAADTFTYVDLVHRLVDMEHLAVLPGRWRDLPTMVQLRSRQPIRSGDGQVCAVGCQ